MLGEYSENWRGGMSIILKKTIERKTVIRQQHELPRKESVILHGQSSWLLLLGVYDIILPPNVWISSAGIS